VAEVVGLPPMRWAAPAIAGGGQPVSTGTGPVDVRGGDADYTSDLATAPDDEVTDRIAIRFAATAIDNLRNRRPSVTDEEALAFGRMMLEQIANSNGNGHRKEVNA
jgi:hypothetical protein